MDIRQLQFLCALDRHRHFGRAAEACHVTQPTLSMRLRNLEDELGVTLIERRQRFEGFTAEGERLLTWARQAVSAFDGLKNEAHRLQGQLVGTLRIGMVPLSHVGLMPALRTLHLQAPNIRFQLQALSSQQILEQLENNQLDAGLTYLAQVEMKRYQVIPLGSPGVGLLGDASVFPLLTDTDELGWEALTQVPLGLLSEAMRFRQGLERSARLQGIELNPLLESDAVEHLLEAAQAGLCCTLIPLPPPHALPPSLTLRPLAAALPQPALALACKQADGISNPLLQALLACVRTKQAE